MRRLSDWVDLVFWRCYYDDPSWRHRSTTEPSRAGAPAASARPSMYDELKAKGAGYCPCCGSVVTPDDLKRDPIRPAPVAASSTERP